MTLSDIAKKLFGAKRAETTSKTSDVSTLQGTVVSDSENGHVEVAFDADCTTLDGTNVVSIGTLASLKEGDQAIVMLEGGGVKRPTAIGAAGWGDRIQASIVETNLLIADKADIEDLEAANAHIGNLEADNLTINNRLEVAETSIGTLEAETAKIENLTAEQLEATTAYIEDLTAGNVTAQNIVADHGDFDTVKANAAKVQNLTAQQLEADHATVGSLDANYAKIDLANIANGTIKTAMIGDAQITTAKIGNAAVGTANIKNAAITNALIANEAVSSSQILSVSANKLTAGTINAAEIDVTNLHASSLIVDKLNGQPVLGGYAYVNKNISGYSSKNPSQEGWYEMTANGFALSTDTSVDSTKAYYTQGNPTKLYDQDYIDGLEEGLNQRIDGAIETFTGDHVPTLNTYPAVDWTTDDAKSAHVGDIYFVTNAALNEDGYNYRFAYDNATSSYRWVLIKDSDVTKALQDITDLQDFESDTTSWINETDQGLTTIRQNHTALSGVVDKTVKESVQLWYTKADTTAPGKPTSQVTSTSTAGNAWRTVVPAWNASYPNYYYCWQYKLADNTYAWSDVVRDIAMGESQGTSRSAQTTANGNIKSSVQLWYTKANSTAPSKPTSQVTTNNSATGNAWNLAVPTYNASYPHYFYCYQQQKGDGSYQWSDVVYDKGTTEAMQKAQAALPSSTFTTFQQNTFKELVDEVDEQSSTITQMTETMQYGGANLILASDTMTDVDDVCNWNINSTSSSIEDGVCTLVGDDNWREVAVACGLRLADYKNKYLTISFDMRAVSTGATFLSTVEVRPTSSALSVSRSGAYRTQSISSAPTTTWARYSQTFHMVEGMFTSGSGQPDWTTSFFAVAIFNHGSIDYQIRHIKVEVGEIATPWGCAPQDVTTVSNVVNSVKQTADANTASISGLSTVVSNNGLTSTTNITSRASKIEQTLDGFSSTVGAIVDETVTGTNILTGNALNPYNWTVSAPSGASYTKTAYGTAGVKVQFSAISGWEWLYSPAITVVSGKKYTLSVEYTVGKDYTITSGKGGFGLSVYKTTPPHSNYDSANANFIARAQFFETATRVAMKATVTFTASSNTVYLGLNGGQINDSQTGLEFTMDKLTLVENISSRMSSAETSITQTSNAIGLTATGTATIANPNLTPFFESAPYRTSASYDGQYWQPTSDNWLMSGITKLDDGWAHLEVGASKHVEITPHWIDSVDSSKSYTLLIEWKDVTVTGSPNLYARNYPASCQFTQNRYHHAWSAGGPSSGADYVKMTVDTTAKTSSWLAAINLGISNGSGTSFSGDLRLSIYEGEYSGPWKPYSGSQLYASQAELRVTADGISSVVSKIPGAKYLTSSVAGWALSSIRGYAVENTETTFNVTSSQNVRVGDTVYIKGMDNTRVCPVYIKGTVVAVPNSTQVKIAAHGYEDALPTDSAISSINQSAESVKIQASKIEIDGTTTFTGGGTLSSYVQGKVDEVEVGGRNLLKKSADLSHWVISSCTVAAAKADPDGGTGAFLITPSSAGWYASAPITDIALKNVGEQYTFSIWLRADTATRCGLRGRYISGNYSSTAHRETFDISTEWKRYQITGELLQAQTSDAFWIGQITSDPIYAYHPKVEMGNKATDWTPAPEDQTAYADGLVDGLVIGGRNLATGTGTNLTFTQTSTPTYFSPTGFYSTSDTGLALLANTSNKSFIVSFDWTATGVTTAYQMYPSLQNSSTTYTAGNITEKASVPTGNSSGHYSAVFEPNSGQRQYGGKWLLSRTTNTANTSGTVVLSNFMFEVATKESSWQPAPEDVMKTTTITTATDFNTLKTTGIYYVKVSSNTNAPTTGHGELEVNFNVGTPYQIWQPDAASTAYYKRQYSSSTWSAWTTVDGKAAYDLANTANTRALAYRATSGAAADAAAKTANCAGFTLASGAYVSVRFTNANTSAGALTLNVNETGAKNVYVSRTATSDTNRLLWAAGAVIDFYYDGTQWLATNTAKAWYGSTCSTAEGTAAKTTTVNEVILCKGATVTVPMTNSTTVASKLNVSSLGAANIYHGTSTNSPTKGNGLAWPAGAAVIFTYDGKFWRTGNQTFIDGGNIITGKVSADRINVSGINIGDLNGSLGGRNLVTGTSNTWKELTTTNTTNQTIALFSNFDVTAIPGIAVGDAISVSFDIAIPTATTRGSSATQNIQGNVNKGGSTWTGANFSSTGGSLSAEILDVFTNKKGKHVRLHTYFTVTAAMLNGTVTGNMDCNIRFDYWTGKVMVRRVMVERGKMASEWMPAPEEMAATATNYIKADSTGIKIAKASDTSNYQYQTSSGTDIYVSGKKRTSTNANGLEVFDSDGQTSLAKFGTSARIGKSGGTNVEIEDKLFKMNYLGDNVAEIRTVGLASDETANAGMFSGRYNGGDSVLGLVPMMPGAESFTADDLTTAKIAGAIRTRAAFAGFKFDSSGNVTASKIANLSAVLLPVTLFYNSSGGYGTINLNETVANFVYIEVFGQSNDGEQVYEKVYDPNGKTFTMSVIVGYGTNRVAVKSKRYVANGTQISVSNLGGVGEVEYLFAPGGVDGHSENQTSINKIKIYRVLGLRK